MSHREDQPGKSDAAVPVVIEWRASPRQRILQRCFARPVGKKSTEGWRCIAYSISTLGIGLAMPLALPVGTLFEIEPWDLPGTRPQQVRVVRTCPCEFLWFCGAEFLSPLGDKELHAWVTAPRDWLPPASKELPVEDNRWRDAP
jgi:hypothetical protein